MDAMNKRGKYTKAYPFTGNAGNHVEVTVSIASCQNAVLPLKT